MRLLPDGAQWKSPRSPLHTVLHGLDHRSAKVGVQNRWVHITFSTDAGRVAETRRHILDRLHDVLLCLRLRFERLELLQHGAFQDRSRPVTKIFCRKILVGHLAQVVVYVRGIDRVVVPVAVDVLKQFVARDVLAALDNSCQPAIVDIDRVTHLALPLKLESEARSSTSTCLLRMVVNP